MRRLWRWLIKLFRSEPAMRLEIVPPVTSAVIKLRWSIPEGAGSSLHLDWKLDDGNDRYWPNDFSSGGVLDFADNATAHEFVPIPGKAYAFRIRREDTGKTSKIVKVTAPHR